MNYYRTFIAIAFGLFLAAVAFQSYANHRLVKSLPPKLAYGRDDSNTANQIPTSNASMLPNLQTFLGADAANRAAEMSFANFVDIGFYNQLTGQFANPNACLGTAGPGLTMTPGSPCIAYNAGYRSTCGVGNNLGLANNVLAPPGTPDCPGGNSITLPNNSTCWVAMDENTTGNNAGMANFTRVTGTHYLLDCLDTHSPPMPADGQLLMETTTSGGSITLVLDLRNKSPFTPPLNGANPIVQSIICAGGVPCDLIGFNTAGTIDPRGYGAKLDFNNCADITVTNGSKTITSAGCTNFTGRAGELIQIYNPSNETALLDTTIASVSSATSATLTATYTGANFVGNGGALYCNDDMALTDSFINSQPINSSFTIQMPVGRAMCVGTPFNTNARNVTFRGAGPRLGGGYGNTTGTVIIPIFSALPSPPAVFYQVDTWGAEIGNLAIAGDALYGHSLNAIMTQRNTGIVGAQYPQTHPYFHDLEIGNLAIFGLSFSNGAPVFQSCLDILGTGAQNDRGTVNRVECNFAVNGVQFCPDLAHPGTCQAIEWQFHRYSNNRVAVGVDMSHGGAAGNSFYDYEGLSDGIEFYTGDVGKLVVKDFFTEHGGLRTTYCNNWSASTAYPRNFCVQSTADGSLWWSTTANGAICTSSGSIPACLVTSAPGTTCADNTCTWTAVSNPPSTIAVGIGTSANTAGELDIEGGFWDANGWNTQYGTPGYAIASADGGDYRLKFDSVNFNYDATNPPTANEAVIDLTATAQHAVDFQCTRCGALGLNVGPTNPGNLVGIYTHVFSGDVRQVTRLRVDRLPGYPHTQNGDYGESFVEMLINGATPDNNLWEYAGQVSADGSLVVPGLNNASGFLYSASCNSGGANTYLYKYTAVDHNGESLPESTELTVGSCCTIGVAGCVMNAALMPLKGASNYRIYRTQAGGATGTERFDLATPANATYVGSLGINSFQDNATDASIVGNVTLPTVNTTGYVSARILGTAKLAGALPTAPGAGTCQLFTVAGTGGGTCKLQAVCGTSTTPVTVVDNVGSGC